VNGYEFVEEEDGDITLVIVEFPSDPQAEKAFENLGNWINKGDREDVSVYRVTGAMIAAVLLTESGMTKPIIRRLKKLGGRLTDLPEETKRKLVDRTLDASEQGLVGEDRGIFVPLDRPPDPSTN